MGEFGDKFRKARESKNLTFDAVSNVTKISSRMLQAIENERFDQLPGGVFNKGFIRAYAKHLGLNDEEAISDYLACLRQAQIDAQEVLDPARPTNAGPKNVLSKDAPKRDAGKSALRAVAPEKRSLPYDKPSLQPLPPIQVEESHAEEEELPGLQLPRAEDVRPPRPAYAEKRSGTFGALVALALVVVALVAFLWIRHTRAPHSQVANSNALAAVNNATPPPVSTAPSTPPAPAPQNVAPKPAPHTATPQPAASENAAPQKTQTTTANPESNVVEKSDVTIRTFGNPNAPPQTNSAATITLIIHATETCWISVIADGQLVTQETLIAPAATSFHATRQIVARIGNAAGVTFLLNGKEIPAQGTEAEVKTFTFDSSGIHPTPN